MNFLSHDSRCWSFDSRANGYARGEGFGVVIIKRLRDAVKDGDTIRAVIRSTGLNQDGRTPGITVPSGEAQRKLILSTYAKAGLERGPTRFFEAHGTGTPVGDPIEAHAISEAFRGVRTPDDPLFIGAVKSNIGHLEGGSGVAGLIKTIMVLERGIILPNTGLDIVNPGINPDRLGIRFPTKSLSWPTLGLRRACVNSFGFGGSNAVVVLDDAYHVLEAQGCIGHHRTIETPPIVGEAIALCAHGDKSEKTSIRDMPETSARTGRNPILLVWSAADEKGIQRLGALYETYFKRQNMQFDRSSLNDLLYTLGTRRTSFTWRSYLVADYPIATVLRQMNPKYLTATKSNEVRKAAFVFTGQGAQYAQMGRELLAYPSFSSSFTDSEMQLRKIGCPWSLAEELLRDETSSVVDDPEYSQPLCTALQIALVDLLRTFGIQAAAVVGHSSGEISAAYCTGALDRTTALKIAFHRGALTAKLARSKVSDQAMMSVNLSKDKVEDYLSRIKGPQEAPRVEIGCVNSPSNVTLTGDKAPIDLLESVFNKDSVSCRRLRVNIAYHSSFMKEIASDYLMSLGCLDNTDTSVGSVPMISTVTGTSISKQELCEAKYWVQNMVSPVLFSQALFHLCNLSRKKQRNQLGPRLQRPVRITDLLEIGPHPALRGPIREILAAERAISSVIEYSPTLVRKVSAAASVVNVAGRLWCLGHPINILAVNSLPETPRTLMTDLPGYPFDHSRSHWVESRISSSYRHRTVARHDLLGTPSSDWNPSDCQWRNKVNLNNTPWIDDHRINGDCLYPGAGMIVMAIEAIKQVCDKDRQIMGYRIRNTSFLKALQITSNTDGVETRFSLSLPRNTTGYQAPWYDFRLFVQEDNNWVECCYGQIQVEYDQSKGGFCGEGRVERVAERFKRRLSAIPSMSNHILDPAKLYELLRHTGADYGAIFRTLNKIRFDEKGNAVAEVRSCKWSTQSNSHYKTAVMIHPATLDAVFQLPFVALSVGGSRGLPTMVPTHVRKLWVSSALLDCSKEPTFNASTRSQINGYRGAESSVIAVSADGSEPRILLEGYETTFVTNMKKRVKTRSSMRQLCCAMDWKPDIDLMAREEILQYCEQSRPQEEPPVQFYRDLAVAIRSFITDSLDSLKGEPIELEPHLKRYVHWMKLQIDRATTGELPIAQTEWPKLASDAKYRQTIIDRVERFNKEGRFFMTVGRDIMRIIRGEVDPLDIFSMDSVASDYCEEVFSRSHMYAPFEAYLVAAAHKNPSMKILEIGAGTGGATAPCLRTLSSGGFLRWAEYDYTDISPSFFPMVQEKFEPYIGRMRFRTLDVDVDPSQQGFKESEYDLIIAASVLHASKSRDSTIRHIRKLLKPGGKIVLFDVTKPHIMRNGFAFGLLKGWWAGVEPQAADQWTPCYSEDAWADCLYRNGFSGLDVSIPDYNDVECHEASIMISSASSTPEDTHKTPEFAIIVSEGSEPQSLIASLLQTLVTGKYESSCEIFTLPEIASRQDIAAPFCIFLVEIETPLLSTIEADGFAQLQKIFTSTRGLLWITKDSQETPKPSQFHMVDGLSRTLRSENPQLKFVRLALEARSEPKIKDLHLIVNILYHTIQTAVEDLEMEYEQLDGFLCVNRVIETKDMNAMLAESTAPQQHQIMRLGQMPPLELSVSTLGSLEALEYHEDIASTQSLGHDEVIVQTKAIGVNSRDFQAVMGQLNTKDLGTECSGVIQDAGRDSGFTRGERVYVSTLSTARTHVRCKALCVARIPDWMSFTDAAAVPTTALVAFHAIVNIARLVDGESILIHHAAGGVGQMAIQIAKHLGARLFVTTSTQDKTEFLKDVYDIPEDHIFSSRETTFVQGIMRLTSGEGVDVVLNSRSGEGQIASWECVARFGRFVELALKSNASESSLPFTNSAKNISFFTVNLPEIIHERPCLIRELLKGVGGLIDEGRLRPPTPVRVFQASESEQAFAFFQDRENFGKCVIECAPDSMISAIVNRKAAWNFDSQATYVIAGGLGGLGRGIARWMASRGAQYMVLLSRSGAKSEAGKALVDELSTSGVRVEAPCCDITQLDVLERVIAEITKTMPPIKGCVQGTMVLRDTIFENMTFEDFTVSTRPKVHGSWHLHKVLPKGLDIFILLSSISGILGGPGQANYCAGNTSKDALAHHRISHGEKAVSIDLGMIVSEGVVAETDGMLKSLRRKGWFMEISQTELLALLDHYCNPDLDVLTPLTCQVIVGIELPSVMEKNGIDVPHWMRRPLFRHLHNMSSDPSLVTADAGNKDSTTPSYIDFLRQASSVEEAATKITEWLAIKISRVLGVAVEDVDASQPLHSYGIDSLVAIEIRNWLEKEVGAQVAIFDILGTASMVELCRVVARKSRYVVGSDETR